MKITTKILLIFIKLGLQRYSRTRKDERAEDGTTVAWRSSPWQPKPQAVESMAAQITVHRPHTRPNGKVTLRLRLNVWRSYSQRFDPSPQCSR